MRTRACTVVIVVLASAVVASGGCTKSAPPGTAPGPASVDASPGADPAAIVARLGNEDLVGQILMPYAYGDNATQVSAASSAANRKYAGVSTPAEMISRYRLGGLILVGWTADDPTAGTNKTTNVDSPAQVRELTSGLRAAAAKLPAGVPLLIGTDQEFGQVTRIRTGVTQLPSAMAFGAAGDPAVTEAAWRVAGAELAALGINVDFAPDADVLGDGGGPIGSRSYGSDPTAVTDQVAAAVRGLQGAGVAATLKHFPGHGHTTANSHTELPVLSQSRDALTSGDLPPFIGGIAAGADLVMSAHLDVGAIDPGVAASFSPKVMVDLLRGRLGYTGVAITDALNMTPAEKYPAGEAAVRAVLAGNDILLMPPDLAAAQKGLLDALKGGRLPRSRMVEAVTRIVALKLRLTATPQPDMSTVDTAEHRAVAARASVAAITVLRGECVGPRVAGPVTVTASGGREQQVAWLVEALRVEGVPVTASGGSVVHLVGYGDDASDLSVSASVTVAMDLPYVLQSATSPTLLATYSSTQASMTALAAVLAGATKALGRSPVAVAGLPRSVCAT